MLRLSKPIVRRGSLEKLIDSNNITHIIDNVDECTNIQDFVVMLETKYTTLEKERRESMGVLDSLVQVNQDVDSSQRMVTLAIANNESLDEVRKLTMLRDKNRAVFDEKVKQFCKTVKHQTKIDDVDWNMVLEKINRCRGKHEAIRIVDEKQLPLAKSYSEERKRNKASKQKMESLDSILKDKGILSRQIDRDIRRAYIKIEELEDLGASQEEKVLARLEVITLEKSLQAARTDISDLKKELKEISKLQFPERVLEEKELEKTRCGEEDSSLCVVCLDKKSTHACTPCGHRVLCSICTDKTENKCPICRQNVQRFYEIFNS
jgi:hypothetical protein